MTAAQPSEGSPEGPKKASNQGIPSTSASAKRTSNQPPGRSPQNFSDRKFWLRLLALCLALLLAGASGFAYLRSRSSLSLLSGANRTLAAATAFIPNKSPLTFSLLAPPEQLIALQQVITTATQRQQFQDEIDQIKQSIQQSTGLDYDLEVQPWLGEEITFSLVDPDLETDSLNQQPGYLLALEIAPGREAQAQAALQLFWQRQTLAGNPPQSELVSGVRLLHVKKASPAANRLTMASALVGNEFVMFANDVRVLRQSIRAAQTADNLAQNRDYRNAVEQLPLQRWALAYICPDLWQTRSTQQLAQNTRKQAQSPIVASIGATRSGLIAYAQPANSLPGNLPSNSQSELYPSRGYQAASSQMLTDAEAALNLLPDSSLLAFAGQNFAALRSALVSASRPLDSLPDFLSVAQSVSNQNATDAQGLWGWANGRFALGEIGLGRRPDWILAIDRQTERQVDGITQLDQAAQAAGYSVVPIEIEGKTATAWTRFQAVSGGRSGGGLKTDILGLHLQQNNYELFASSLNALKAALNVTTTRSLPASARFESAIASLPKPNLGYLYLDWPALSPELDKLLELPQLIKAIARPLTRHIQTLAATQQENSTVIAIELSAQPTDSLDAFASTDQPATYQTSRSASPYRPPTYGNASSSMLNNKETASYQK